MARTQDEIEKSLEESLAIIDPQADTKQGPVHDYLILPVPPELQQTEAEVDRLENLTTQNIDEAITNEETDALARSFSLRRGGGKTSKTKKQAFFTYTKPLADIPIPRGVLVGTDLQEFTYVVRIPATLPAATADAFFNSVKRRYEIFVECEATSIGPGFDLPTQRVRRLITDIDGIDGTENIDAYAGGVIAETNQETVSRIRSKFAGRDPESGGGIISDIKNFDIELVRDVSLVYPKDRGLYLRNINRPGLDAYVIGEDPQTVDQTSIADGGEIQITIENRPVLEVNTVTVNGATVPFSFVQDTTILSGGSTYSTDSVVLDTPLSALDSVVINYTYNALIFDMQAKLFGDERPFDTDVQARSPRVTLISVSLVASVLASFDVVRVEDALTAALFDEVQPGYFLSLLSPSTIRDRLKASVGGLRDLQMTKFTRTSGGRSQIEPIDINKNEQSFVDQTNLNITVRQ